MALLNSRRAGRPCPVCGAAHCECNFLNGAEGRPLVTKLPEGGPMVHIPMGRKGVTMQMPLERAVALGLWPPEQENPQGKRRASARNKKREPEANK